MSQRYLGGIITANPTTPTMTSESGVWTLEQQFQYSSVWSPETIGNSLRFRSSASAYLNRTPASASNRKTWTFSAWIKRGDLSGSYNKYVFSATPSVSVRDAIYFGTAQTLSVFANDGASALLTTTQVFRDPSAWYHIVVAVDTTQATSSNRIKVYVNGVQVTAFGTATYPSLDYQWAVNNTVRHTIGDDAANAPTGLYNYDGYMAEIYFVDGQALTPSSFGAFDSTGVWQPLAYTGTFGTNGFYVDFSDNSGTTATTLGKDYSGNGNNWTPNNFSLTTGATYDWMLDTPTNSDNGGTGRGNYCVLNPLIVNNKAGEVAQIFSSANLQVRAYGDGSGSPYTHTQSTIGVSSGKYYFEVTHNGSGGGGDGFDNEALIGVVNTNSSPNVSIGDGVPGLYYTGNGAGYYRNGSIYATGSTVNSSGDSYTTGAVIGVAIDCDAGRVWFSKNGVWQGTGSPDPATATAPNVSSLPSGGVYVPAVSNFVGSSVRWSEFIINCGQRPFAYTPPTGFKALNTQNLSSPTIMNGAQVMAATTYTGTGANQTIANSTNTTIGTSFKPDLVWIKSRSAATNNRLVDSVRGNYYLVSNSTAAEVASGTMAIQSNGFLVGTDSDINNNAATYVGWQWQAGQGTTSSNTSGSITSTVSVNATAGFSVVTWTGNFTAGATIGHGLGVAPSMVLVFRRSTGGNNHSVYHTSVGATKSLFLDTPDATNTDVGYWNNTAPTTSVITLGQSNYTNPSSGTMVAYCWAAVAGYSAFGSYTGNGSADGPFVYCGFRPRFILLKNSGYDNFQSWVIYDTSRSTYNVDNVTLQPNSSNAESTSFGADIDILSNGFKVRNSNTVSNASGTTIIYAAFAENPFKIARAR